MDDVLRLEREVDFFAERQIQLVRGDQRVGPAARTRRGVLRIAELPPPLMSDDFDLKRIGARRGLRLHDGLHRGHADHDQDEEGDDGPRDLQRGVAVNVFGLGLSRPGTEPDQRPDQEGLYKKEDRRAGDDEDSEKEVYNPIEVCALVKDRIGMVSTTGGEQSRSGNRQRDRTRFAGTRPAQAGYERHAVSLLNRAFRAHPKHALEASCVKHAEPTGSTWQNQPGRLDSRAFPDSELRSASSRLWRRKSRSLAALGMTIQSFTSRAPSSGSHAAFVRSSTAPCHSRARCPQ